MVNSFSQLLKKWTDMYSKNEETVPKEDIQFFIFRLGVGWLVPKQFYYRLETTLIIMDGPLGI